MRRTPVGETTYIHPAALCESKDVGPGSKVWAFAHIMEGARVGANCNIGDHVFIESGAILGDGVTVKNGVMVWEGVHLEADVFVGPNVLFTNDRYPRSQRRETVPSITKRYAAKETWLETTRVGRGASLGAGAVIGPGVTIGEYAMVGAGAVIVSNVGPFRLMVGNPGRPEGWVCRAGYRLDQVDDETLSCPQCGRTVLLGDTGPAETGC